MYLDEIMSKAKAECDAFLHIPRSSRTEEKLTSLLKAATLAMAALSWAASVNRYVRTSILLCSYETMITDLAEQAVKTTRYFLTPDGEIIRQSTVTCESGCHEFGQGESEVTVAQMMKDGVRPDDIARNLSGFLSDPKGDLLDFAAGPRN